MKTFILGTYCPDEEQKVFYSNINRPLADRCMGYIVNKFERSRAGLVEAGESPVDMFKRLFGGGT